ncbi:MAG: aminomethyl-transferring glycine dehydrogenase subunit GcvPB [Candidatus Odinarchaeota archaeon]
MRFQQARWDEALVFERSRKGAVGYSLPKVSEIVRKTIPKPLSKIPKSLRRLSPPGLPELSEPEVMQHFIRLSQMNYCIDLGLYPLGSCTMKYNPPLNEEIIRNQQFSLLHPHQDSSTLQGILQIFFELQQWLAEISGVDSFSLQPAAGAQGELAGVLIIRAYHANNGELDTRREIIIPDSAHGTNPASATMAGFDVVVVPSNQQGQVDLQALQSAVSDQTAGLMLTNPNTLGLFEQEIETIAKIVHKAGGLLYYDGANLNANLGRVRPGDMGFDIIHINLHKTFATPHGGGGPGAGPIGVKSQLVQFLPVPVITFDGKKYILEFDRPKSIGRLHGFFGNAAVSLKAYAYILRMGWQGLQAVSNQAVLNANYLMKQIGNIKGFSIPFAPGVWRKHEVVVSAKPLEHDTGVNARDVAKALLDRGLHAPTFYFPSIVEEALMIEPTETFSKDELDRFIAALHEIAEEAYTDPQKVCKAPQHTAITRLDEVKAAHPRTMALTWRMYQKYQK